MIDEPSKELAPRTAKNAGSLRVNRDTPAFKREFADWLIHQSRLPRDQRETQQSFAERSHIPATRLSEWRGDRDFIMILRDRLPDSLVNDAPEMYATMVKYALRGDQQMMKLALQQAKLLEAEKHETRSLNVNVDVSGVPRRGADGP